jgi:hypothetical protein
MNISKIESLLKSGSGTNEDTIGSYENYYWVVDVMTGYNSDFKTNNGTVGKWYVDGLTSAFVDNIDYNRDIKLDELVKESVRKVKSSYDGDIEEGNYGVELPAATCVVIKSVEQGVEYLTITRLSPLPQQARLQVKRSREGIQPSTNYNTDNGNL